MCVTEMNQKVCVTRTPIIQYQNVLYSSRHIRNPKKSRTFWSSLRKFLLSRYKFRKPSVSSSIETKKNPRVFNSYLRVRNIIGRWIAGTNHHALATRRRSEEFRSSNVTGSRLILGRRRSYQFRCASLALRQPDPIGH